MDSSYTLIKGTVPLLISMPHNGQQIPDDIALTMTEFAKSVVDTDWYKDRLYDFAQSLGAYIIIPKYSRYVIDLNRDPHGIDLYPDENSTELCPLSGFDLSPIYLAGQQPNGVEISRRIKDYWQPYHQAINDTLDEMKTEFGQAVLLDAHSILSHVPRFFDGQLPDFNFGTSSGKSCSVSLVNNLENIVYAPYSMVIDGRFKGGFITRHFGNPGNNIHAIQLELSQRTYMNELTTEYNLSLAEQVQQKLRTMVICLIDFAIEHKRDKHGE
ncbi:MAG: N-formylglutamate deformylase [Alteromonadaceae bacterium]|jgi:N-formylglutamate deformylase|tara:strand:+ start:1751 stop:2560 length:810 start_codon:yes stop_codon:yes gene_type:complete